MKGFRLSGTSGRHASHAKPGRLSTTKARVTTAVAVSGVVVLGGGVAGAEQLRHHAGHQQEADSEAARFADAQAAKDIAARSAAKGVTNRDLTRPPLVAVTTPSGASDSQQVELFDSSLTPTGATGSTGSATPTSAAGPTGTASPSASPTGPAGGPAGATSSGGPSSSPKTTPSTGPTAKPTPTTTSSTGGLQGYNATPAQARALAQQLVPAAQFACFDNIITRESSWNIHATNASSGAYGLAQALPGSKMGTVASDWRTNAVTQIKWAIGYMTSRYGSPCAAWAFWQNHHWY